MSSIFPKEALLVHDIERMLYGNLHVEPNAALAHDDAQAVFSGMHQLKGLPLFWVLYLFLERTLSYTVEQPPFEHIAALAQKHAQAKCSHL